MNQLFDLIHQRCLGAAGETIPVEQKPRCENAWCTHDSKNEHVHDMSRNGWMWNCFFRHAKSHTATPGPMDSVNEWLRSLRCVCFSVKDSQDTGTCRGTTCMNGWPEVMCCVRNSKEFFLKIRRGGERSVSCWKEETAFQWSSYMWSASSADLQSRKTFFFFYSVNKSTGCNNPSAER